MHNNRIGHSKSKGPRPHDFLLQIYDSKFNHGLCFAAGCIHTNESQKWRFFRFRDPERKAKKKAFKLWQDLCG